MKKMNSVKKIALGTALSGALIVGAGFGTYSWFTSSVDVSGEIQNATVEISTNESMNFAISLSDKLAPSRTATGSFTVDNDSSEAVIIKADLKLGEGTAFPNNGLLDVDADSEVDRLSKYTFTFKNGSDVLATVNGEDLADGESATIFTDRDFAKDEVLAVTVEVHLADDANNNHQGATIVPFITIEAKQTDDGSKYDSEIE